jgi:hypothetical protein
LKLALVPACSPLPVTALPSMSLIPSVPFASGPLKRQNALKSGVGDLSARFRNWATELARGLDPFVDHDFGVCHGLCVRLAVGHATGQFRYFDNETIASLLQ